MTIQQEAFIRYHEKKQIDSFSVRLNEDERILLNKCKSIIEQPKDSTALKQLAFIGAKVIHEQKINYILSTIFKNKKKNKRIGLSEFD